ncbi:6343_t:CDS:2, partial [Scutellospora calospora]
LCKQEQHLYLSEMIFLTYQESQNIRLNKYANESEILTSSRNDDNSNIKLLQFNIPISASTLQKYNIADIADLNSADIY